LELLNIVLFFLKGVECTNKECLFLHKIADESDIIKRGDLTINKNIFNQQHKYAIKIVDIYNPEVKKKILSLKKGKTIFPSPDVIYKTLTGIEKEANNSKNKKSNVKDKEKISPVKENKIKETEDKNNNKFDFINDSNEYKKKKRLSEEENYEEEEEDDAEDEENYENDDDNNINNSIDIKNKKNFENKKNKELLNRDKSRFDFCEKNTNENISNNIIMPEHIINLINKKINSFILTKYMQQKLIDKMFLNESIKNVSALCDLKDIKVIVKDSIDSTIICDSKWQIEAITNILKNSIYYYIMENGKTLKEKYWISKASHNPNVICLSDKDVNLNKYTIDLEWKSDVISNEIYFQADDFLMLGIIWFNNALNQKIINNFKFSSFRRYSFTF